MGKNSCVFHSIVLAHVQQTSASYHYLAIIIVILQIDTWESKYLYNIVQNNLPISNYRFFPPSLLICAWSLRKRCSRQSIVTVHLCSYFLAPNEQGNTHCPLIVVQDVYSGRWEKSVISLSLQASLRAVPRQSAERGERRED